MSTPAQVAAKFAAAADGIARTPRRVTEAAALTVKRSVQAHLVVAAPRGRLNVGRKGARVGVRYTLAGNTAVVKMTGPAQLIERDTKAHRIPRATVGRGRRQRANTKVVVIPGVGVRASAAHPGTRGKHPWEKGLRAALPAIPKAAADAYFAPLRQVFR